ncbi:unnamed protein product [Hymenolepis diminuta]|uniref:Uncharacterized protein n=1 Tax=Hymenolepis diminuta TaxID=6216 RepID=A0A0R3SMA9_HYMDI|nr:unnamed protein product [Hymenolepis diminuta]
MQGASRVPQYDVWIYDCTNLSDLCQTTSPFIVIIAEISFKPKTPVFLFRLRICERV